MDKKQYILIIELPFDSAVPLPGIYTKEMKWENRYLYTHVPSSTIHNRQRVETDPSVHGWMRLYTKRGTSLMIQCYSALKRSEVLTHVTSWRNLEDITLSEINSRERANFVRFHSREVPKVVRFIETESRTVVPRN